MDATESGFFSVAWRDNVQSEAHVLRYLHCRGACLTVPHTYVPHTYVSRTVCRSPTLFHCFAVFFTHLVSHCVPLTVYLSLFRCISHAPCLALCAAHLFHCFCVSQSSLFFADLMGSEALVSGDTLDETAAVRSLSILMFCAVHFATPC